MKIILERGNEIGTACLGHGEECWLVAQSYEDPIFDNLILLADHGLNKHSIFKVPRNEDAADNVQVSFYTGSVTWERGAFDSLVSKVADDEQDALLVNKETKRIFAPYDGGFDLFLEDDASVVAFKNKFSGWMSARDDWL